jgi:hypothetical protein
MKCHNPFAFYPGPVTFWVIIVYLALAIPLIIIHETIPPVPSNSGAFTDTNISEAWLDLARITKTYHPQNSQANDDVRNYLHQRVIEIIEGNGADWTTDKSGGVIYSSFA